MKNTTNWVVKYNCWLLISPFLLIKSIKIHSSACFTPDFLSKNFQSLAWSHGVNVPHHQPQHPSTIPMGPSEPRHFSRCTLPSFSDLDSQVPIHFSVTRPPSKGTGYLHGDGGMEGWKKDEKKQMKPSKKWVTLLKAIKYDEGSLKFFSSWKTRKKKVDKQNKCSIAPKSREYGGAEHHLRGINEVYSQVQQGVQLFVSHLLLSIHGDSMDWFQGNFPSTGNLL